MTGRPAGAKPGSPEALAWALAEAELQAEASALGFTLAGSPTANDRKARAAVAAANKATYPHLWCREEADALGVDLAVIKGSGLGGRIRPEDIRAAAGLVPDPTTGASNEQPVGVHASGPMSANPLVSAAHAERPGQAVKAAAKGPAPTLFTGGDLPPFTASGIDPSALLSVPWNARHALAQAATTQEAYKIVDEFVGMTPADAELHAGTMGFDQNEGAGYYRARVAAWLAAGMSEDDVYSAIGYNDPSRS